MIALKLFWSFFTIGLGAYGGGIVTIPLIEHEVVTVNGWLSAEQLSELIAVAQMTPGPIAVNAATFTGYEVGSIPGAVCATAGVILPSILFCSTLIFLFSRFGHLAWLSRLRKAVQPAVLGLIITAVFTYGSSAVIGIPSGALALSTFAVLTLFRDRVHPVLLIVLSGIAGILLY